MRGPVYDVEPGAEYLIPFARKRLAQTLARTTADCPFLRTRVFDNGTDTADIEAGRFVRRVRIRGGAGAWYFGVLESSTPASGLRQVEVKTAELTGSALTRAMSGIFGGDGFFSGYVRSIGKSFGVFTSAQGVSGATAPLVSFLEPTGTVSSISDIMSLLASETRVRPFSSALGRSRKGVLLTNILTAEDLTPRLYFLDGSMVQSHSTDSSFVLGATVIGVFVVGNEGAEDAYYAYWVSTGSSVRLRLFLAERSQPVDSGGTPTSIVPSVVFDGEHFGTFQSSSVPRVVANDYDVLTVTCPAATSGTAGAREIRINGVLQWASPGTTTGLTAAPGGFVGNYDDSFILAMHGDGSRFAVLLTNLAGFYAVTSPSALSGEGVDVFVRELVFTRVSGTYSIAEQTYYISRCNTLVAAGGFFPDGFRTAISVLELNDSLEPTLRNMRFGWLRGGTFSVVKTFGDPYSTTAGNFVLFARSVSVEAFSDRVEAVFQWDDRRVEPLGISYMGFSNSETASFLEVDVSGGSFPETSRVSSVSGDDVHMYVEGTRNYPVSGTLLLPYSFIVRSDGAQTVPTVNGWNPTPSTVELRVDEATRTMFAVVGSTRVGRTVDFGYVREAGVSRRVFVLRNSTGANVEVLGLTIPSGFTLLTPPADEVAAGGETSFTVQLDSTTTGTKSGSITVQMGSQEFIQAVTGVVGTPLALAYVPYASPVYGDMAEIAMKTDYSDVARFDVDAGIAVELAGGFSTFGSLTLPTLTPQYRGRLLAQWAAEDAEL